MARYALVEKYVNGKRYSQQQFKRLVVDTIGKLEEMLPSAPGIRARQIAEALGDPAWVEPANLQLLAQTLSNMKSTKLLNSPERGCFVVNKARVAYGIDQSEQYERIFEETLAENGGFGRTKLLHDATDSKPGESGHVIGTRILQSSTIAQKHYDGALPALRNLPPEKLATIPFTGRWARLQFAYGMRVVADVDPEESYKLADAECTAFFKRIGALYKRVVDMTGEDLVEVLQTETALADALIVMGKRHPDRSSYRSAIIKSYVRTDGVAGPDYARLAAKGWSPDDIDEAMQRAIEKFEDEFHFTVFDLYCEGDYMAHFVAGVEFHRAFAEWAGVDAAQLSRGLIIWNLIQTKRMTKLASQARPYEEVFAEDAEED